MPEAAHEIEPLDLRLYIAGEWREAVGRHKFTVVDPATGLLLAEAPRADADDVTLAVQAAGGARRPWRHGSLQRGRLLLRIGHRIQAQEDALARYESLNTGKPLNQALTDVRIAARYFEYYGGLADKLHGSSIPLDGGSMLDFTVREPVGVVALIVPWNYPLQVLARGLAPALAAGNTVVIKPAEETPITALLLARIMEEEGVPPGVVNVVTGYGEEAGAPLAAHPGVNHVDFTGSREVGMSVMRAAANNIVPVTLELGGKSPHVVFKDADIEHAVPVIVRAILQNAGQTCSAGSRLLVERPVYDRVMDLVAAAFQHVRIGHGLTDPDLGPLISSQQRDRVIGLCREAVDDGGQVVYGGHPTGDSGWFFEPTLLADVPYRSRAMQEEIFGPVLLGTPFDSPAEAVDLANGTNYGLVAAVWTQNISVAMSLAQEIESGQVFINAYGAGGGVEIPFGGMRQSGFGRAKGLEALAHYTRVKNIAVATG